jgi:hypothetical protein
MLSSYVKFNICMLRRHLFYTSLLLGRGCPVQGQICSCGAGTSTSDAPAVRGCPEEAVWRIFATLLWEAYPRRRGGDPTPWRNDAPSLAGAFKNLLNIKTPASTVFSPGHPPPRGRETYRPSIHRYVKFYI